MSSDHLLLARLASVRSRRHHRCWRVPCWTCEQLDQELELIQSEVETLLSRTDNVPAHVTVTAS